MSCMRQLRHLMRSVRRINFHSKRSTLSCHTRGSWTRSGHHSPRPSLSLRTTLIAGFGCRQGTDTGRIDATALIRCTGDMSSATTRVRSQALNEELTLPSQRLGAHSNANTGSPKVCTFEGAADTASVWALSAKLGGDQLAGVTSDGQLHVVQQTSYPRPKAKMWRTIDSTLLAQVLVVDVGEKPTATAAAADADKSKNPREDATADVAARSSTRGTRRASRGRKSTSSTAAPAQAAPLQVQLLETMTDPSPFNRVLAAEVRSALRSVDWNPNAECNEWLACGGCAGVVLVMRVH